MKEWIVCSTVHNTMYTPPKKNQIIIQRLYLELTCTAELCVTPKIQKSSVKGCLYVLLPSTDVGFLIRINSGNRPSRIFSSAPNTIIIAATVVVIVISGSIIAVHLVFKEL